MATHRVTLLPEEKSIEAQTGALVSEAIEAAGFDISQPCGGQGRCGRCAVLVEEGSVRRRSTIRLSADDLSSGWALACQSVIEGDVTVTIYSVNGQMIRRLELGARMPGHYVDRSKAAYWNGTNESGEQVSSGIYFYQLQTGRESAVRKMIIVK